MTDTYATETYMPAATASGVSRDGAATAVAERQTVIPETMPHHFRHLRPAGEAYERRQEPGTAECPILPDIQPGQVWVVEHASTDLRLWPRAHRVISAANVVIYDRALYAIVAANLPLGGYAEPASSQDEPFDTPIDRCLQFARDGWSVVWIVDHRLQRSARGERIRHLVDRLIDGGYPAHLPVTVSADGHGNILEKTETSLGLLGHAIGAEASGDCLMVAFGAVGTGVAPDLYAISSNGLAG